MKVMNQLSNTSHCLYGENERYEHCNNLATYFETNCVNDCRKDNYIAAIHNDSFLTYRMLNTKANIVAKNLIRCFELEIPTNECLVGILLDEGFERLYSIMACLKLGLVIVPLAKNRNSDLLKRIIDKCNLSIIIHKKYSDIEVLSNDDNIQTVLIDTLLDESKIIDSSNLQREYIQPQSRDKTVILLHTSGSSGTPKTIKITSTQLFNRLFWQWRNLPFKSNEIVCHRTGFMFVDNIVECLSCILSTVTMVIVSPTEACDIVKLAEVIQKYSVSWILTVPSLLQKWIKQLDNYLDILASLSSLSTIVSSGEMLFPSLAKQCFTTFNRNICKLVNLYGSTEVCGDVCCQILYSVNDVKMNSKNKFLSVGSPISNNQVFLESNSDNEGEVIVIGKNVSPTCGLAFQTGDVGFIDDKKLYICGRVDDMVKINGKKIFTKDISTAVMIHSDVDNCYTIQLIISGKSQLVSFFTTKTEIANKTKMKMEITNILMNHSLNLCLPRLEYIKSIPIQSQSMKPDKKMLCKIASKILSEKRAMKTKLNHGNHLLSFPTTPNLDDLTDHLIVEIKSKKRYIYEILAKHLNILPDEIHDSMNFYDLGGDSLTIVICISDLNRKGFSCTTEVFFHNHSIGDLVNCILEQSNMKIRNNSDHKLFKYDMKNDFIVEQIQYENKTEIIEFLVENFYTKELVVRYLNTPVKVFIEVVSEIFDLSLRSGCSFCIRNSISKSIVGIQLSEDSSYEIPNSNQFYKLNSENSLDCFLQNCKPRMAEFLKTPKLNVSVVALSGTLKKSIVIQLLYFIEKHTIDLARCKNYKTIETINTSEATKSDFDETFDNVDSGASLYVPKQMSAFRKGQYIMIKDRPCKIADMSTCKTGKHGSAKVQIVAIDIFTDKKLEDVSPSTANREMPIVKRIEFQLIDISGDGYTSLMSERGDIKEDVQLPGGDLDADIRARFEKGDQVVVTVMSACNEEKIVSVKTVTN